VLPFRIDLLNRLALGLRNELVGEGDEEGEKSGKHEEGVLPKYVLKIAS